MDKIYEFLKKVDVVKLSVAFTILSCFNLLVWAAISKEIPQGNREIVIHTMGVIEGVVLAMAAFYWGSSAGSKEKTDVIAKLKDKQHE